MKTANRMQNVVKGSEKYKNLWLKFFGLILIVSIGVSCKSRHKTVIEEKVAIEKLTSSIQAGANSWVVGDPETTAKIISDKGISNWKNPSKKIRTYFRTEKTGKIHLGLKAKAIDGKSILKFTFNGVSKQIEIGNVNLETLVVGTFEVKEPGYQFVELEGLEKEGEQFPEISELLIGGNATTGDLYYVKDDVYWGRRGPSVHLSYQKPKEAGDIVWFYNEITVPEGNDVLGSYYMANGFGEGYFGMQVNSKTERRFLFSVWSPFKTDDPSSIPKDKRITLLKKGKNVTTGKFGNEGSGGQSYRKYYWKTGNTYKFLLKGKPSINNSTDYTAYIFAPEIGKWELIASFRRPKTSTYLTRPHSFLENFSTQMGDESRKAIYTNQWVYDTNNTWHEIVKAKFTADATARKDARLDYAGGAENKSFYLKNCGFFNERTVIDSFTSREASGKEPEINFELLP